MKGFTVAKAAELTDTPERNIRYWTDLEEVQPEATTHTTRINCLQRFIVTSIL